MSNAPTHPVTIDAIAAFNAQLAHAKLGALKLLQDLMASLTDPDASIGAALRELRLAATAILRAAPMNGAGPGRQAAPPSHPSVEHPTPPDAPGDAAPARTAAPPRAAPLHASMPRQSASTRAPVFPAFRNGHGQACAPGQPQHRASAACHRGLARQLDMPRTSPELWATPPPNEL